MPRRNDFFRADKTGTPKQRSGAQRILRKQPVDGADLRHSPQLAGAHLPKQTFVFDMGERRIPHGLRTVPELTVRPAMQRNLTVHTVHEIIEIVGGSVFAAAASVNACRRATVRREARRDVM